MGTRRGKPPRKTERGRNMSFTPGVERGQTLRKCRPTWISQNFERNGIGLNARSDTSVFASTSVGP